MKRTSTAKIVTRLVVDLMNFDRDWHRFVISNDLLYNLSIVDLPLKSR